MSRAAARSGSSRSKSPRSASADLAPDGTATTGSGYQRRDQRFPYWFAQVSRALSQQLLLHFESRFGLNLAEYRTLNTVAEMGSRSIRDIAVDASLDKSQVSRALAALTARGLVIQVVDRSDRRLRVVKLTPAGEALIAETVPFVTERQRHLEQTLSETERRVLWKALTVISKEADLLLARELRAGARRKLLLDRETTETD